MAAPKGNQYAVGNKGGSGRPPESNKKPYIAITRDFLTPERWGEILQSAFTDAVNGETAFDRNLGREFFAKRMLPNKVEVEFNGEFPVKVVAVEGFSGWGETANAEHE